VRPSICKAFVEREPFEETAVPVVAEGKGGKKAPAAKKAPPPKEDKKAAAKKGGAEPAGAPAEADVAGLQRLAAALARLPRLRMLDLGDNRLGPAGARLHSSSDEKRIVA
jgi:hypothetical protein